MRLSPTLSLILALMLTAALPLRGFAAAAQCGGFTGIQAGHAAHCHNGAATGHHGGCSDSCCAAAVVLASSRWIPPRTATGGIEMPGRSPPPSLAPKRLDRPPRPRG
jgi:hypothetical protein